MALFNDRENLAESTYKADNVYSKNPWLKYLGYKESGEMNTWGKISSYVSPMHAIGANFAAQHITKDTDAHGLISKQQEGNYKKLGAHALIAASIATGGIAGAGIAAGGAAAAAGTAAAGTAAAGTAAAGTAAAGTAAPVAGGGGGSSQLIQKAIAPALDVIQNDLNSGQDTDDYYSELGEKRKTNIGRGI